ncbi:MAG TPA: hypothetical protein VGM98_17540 [Schlesneria sp.]
MGSIEWLNANAPGFRNLTLGELEAITHFSLVWSFFEAKVLNNNANTAQLRATAKKLDAAGRLTPTDFDEELSYFRNRYVSGGNFTEFFDGLYLDRQNPDDQALVEGVLRGQNNNLSDIVAALLIIVYRFRNNYFHGEKWAYDMRGQLDNFNRANALLRRVFELCA